LVELLACTGFRLDSYNLSSSSAVSTVAVLVNACVDTIVGPGTTHNLGRSGEGALALTDNTRLKVGPLGATRGTTANTGVRFVGAHTDCIFVGLNVSSFAVGFDYAVGATWSRCVGINCTATGNTDNTNLTTAEIPAVNQLGCTNFAV
jgi:hypothetical protein